MLTLKTGEIYRVTLMEKILCSLLSKLSNYIPEAGIWLNTQRPEWNDANNALVGNGASMVTLCYLRRSLGFWEKILDRSTISGFDLSEEIVTFFEKIYPVFADNRHLIKKGFSDHDRYIFATELGKAGSEYREFVYKHSFSGKVSGLSAGRLKEFIRNVLDFIDQSIDKNRRQDGLYHSYNLVSFNGDRVTVRSLYEMLEGQVAVLSSGYIGTDESLRVLDALRSSKLYRSDQDSYLLYPFGSCRNSPRRIISLMKKYFHQNCLENYWMTTTTLSLTGMKSEITILTEPSGIMGWYLWHLKIWTGNNMAHWYEKREN